MTFSNIHGELKKNGISGVGMQERFEKKEKKTFITVLAAYSGEKTGQLKHNVNINLEFKIVIISHFTTFAVRIVG